MRVSAILPRQVAGRPARALPVACQRGAAVGAPPLRNQKFADSPLEGRVTSELVSEVDFRSSQKNQIFRRFLDDSGLLKSGFARKSPREYEPRSAVGRSAYLHLSYWFN